MPDLAKHKIKKVLLQYWGYPEFRALQEEIILSVMSGKDTLALLPTGGGKSVCFQVPALAMEGICIVVSPLIALMKDQVFQLKRRQISAAAIYSGMSKKEIDITLDNCIYGNVKFLYVSPERLKTDLFLARMEKMKVSMLAIDEAHCISQWGYDFRPPYLEIASLRELLPGVPCIALTATATEAVKVDIQEKLNFQNGQVFQKSFARSNLSYSVFYEESKEKRLVEMLEKVPGTAVVYVRNRKRTKSIAEFLQSRRISASFYHAGLSNDQRAKRQEDWINNKTRVMVATNAFGMGIDKPDVRLVVHMDLPDSLEAYYQEAGRAGRDEKIAYATVLYNQSDTEGLLRNVETSFPAPETIKRVYQSLANFFKIASGSGFMESYDFELEHFAQSYKLEGIQAFYALKKLEELGFIEMNDAFHSSSKIAFLVDKGEIYSFQVANRMFDPLIKAVLRIYGGEIVGNFMNIKESLIAEKMKKQVGEIIQQLEALHDRGVIHYEKQNDKPKVTFLTERYNAEVLPLKASFLEERKQHYLAKVKSVIGYIEAKEQCRTKLLLAYFGEFTNEKCGVCDDCIRLKKEDKFEKWEGPALDDMILEKLEGKKALPFEEMKAGLKHVGDGQLKEMLREMVERGEIKLDESGLISLSE
ncbi:ATP-dependent DNA helicase RecQ [Flammeovirgaceae bacterium SG7u.111]|nr:ATP-dependent DNA helicase RecQ [Flammeovirgaceae bacterium SG7u.132]WPO33568.1 ATP-dependent DNA helicase RecQ [Flammeovirgaceae bacterium SG7u.111]